MARNIWCEIAENICTFGENFALQRQRLEGERAEDRLTLAKRTDTIYHTILEYIAYWIVCKHENVVAIQFDAMLINKFHRQKLLSECFFPVVSSV